MYSFFQISLVSLALIVGSSCDLMNMPYKHRYTISDYYDRVFSSKCNPDGTPKNRGKQKSESNEGNSQADNRNRLTDVEFCARLAENGELGDPNASPTPNPSSNPNPSPTPSSNPVPTSTPDPTAAPGENCSADKSSLTFTGGPSLETFQTEYAIVTRNSTPDGLGGTIESTSLTLSQDSNCYDPTLFDQSGPCPTPGPTPSPGPCVSRSYTQMYVTVKCSSNVTSTTCQVANNTSFDLSTQVFTAPSIFLSQSTDSCDLAATKSFMPSYTPGAASGIITTTTLSLLDTEIVQVNFNNVELVSGSETITVNGDFIAEVFAYNACTP